MSWWRTPAGRAATLVLDYTEEGMRSREIEKRERTRKPGLCPHGCGGTVNDANDLRPHAPRYAKAGELPPGYEDEHGVLIDCIGRIIEPKKK